MDPLTMFLTAYLLIAAIGSLWLWWACENAPSAPEWME